MSGERKGQTEFSGQLRAKVTRTQQPYGHVRAFPGVGMHALRRLRLAKITTQLLQQRWKILARARHGTAESPSRLPITAGGATEAQVNPARKERFERAELFRDGQRRVIGQHDAPGTNADSRGRVCNVTDQDRSRRACDSANIVMLRQPESFVAQRFRALGQCASVVKGFFSRPSLA